MPIISESNLINLLSPQGDNRLDLEPAEKEEIEIPLSDTIGAAVGASQNVLFSPMVKHDFAPDMPLFFESWRDLDRDFNPNDHIQGYESFATEFAYTNNTEEVEQIKSHINFIHQSQRTLAESGWVGATAAITANIADPTLLIPGLAAVKTAKAMKAGIMGAASGAAFAASAIGAQEFVAQQTQPTRTEDESYEAVLAGGIFGGVLGAAVGSLTRAARAGAELNIKKILRGEDIEAKLSPEGNVNYDRSVGASAKASIKDDEGIAHLNDRLTKMVAGPEFLRSTTVQGLTSKFDTVRKTTNDIFEHNFIVGKNVKGVARGKSLEGQMILDEQDIVKSNNAYRDLYGKYSGVKAKGILGDIRGALPPKGKMSFSAFNEEVGKTIRSSSAHAIPEVEQAAKLLRRNQKDLITRLRESGVISQKITAEQATSYFGRRYNFKHIIENEPTIINALTKEFVRLNPKLEVDAAEEIAQETVARMKGLGESSIQMSTLANRLSNSKTNFAKEGAFDVPNSVLDDLGILDRDAIQTHNSFMYQGERVLKMQEYLNSTGNKTVKDLLGKLDTEFRNATTKATSGKERLALDKAFRHDSKLMKDQVDMFLGQFTERKVGDTTLRNLRKALTMTMLGAVTLSSIPDIAMQVFRNGPIRAMRDAYAPLFRNFKTAKLSIDQMKDFNVGAELYNDRILNMMADAEDLYGHAPSKIDKATDFAMKVFGRVSLMDFWNNGHKMIAGLSAQSKIFRGIKKINAGKATQDEIEELASLGIGKVEASRLAKAADPYVEHRSGAYISNHHMWGDKEARDIFGVAVNRDVESTILTPRLGDLPRFARQSEVRKAIFMFKSFSSTATNRLLLSGLQRRDAASAMGFSSLIALGGMTYVLKEKLKGKDPDVSLKRMLIEGMTRSGVLGLTGDYIASLAPGVGSSRYAGASAISVLGGPFAGKTSDLFSLMTAINKDGVDLSDADKKKMIRFIPYQNVFWLRALFDRAFK